MDNKYYPTEEQETVINIQPSRVSKFAEIYTCMPDWLTRLRKQAKSRPDCVWIKRDLGNALFAEVDLSCVKVAPKRKLSEKERTNAINNLKKARAAKDDTE